MPPPGVEHPDVHGERSDKIVGFVRREEAPTELKHEPIGDVYARPDLQCRHSRPVHMGTGERRFPRPGASKEPE